MPALEHPIDIDTREDADAFYAFPEMLFFVAVSRALRKPAARRAPSTTVRTPVLQPGKASG
jgi:hypothetical protein